MNIKQTARVLEHFYEDFKDKLPLTVLPNKAIGYKDYVIKPRKDGSWDLMKQYGHSLQLLDNYNLKACATISAKYHEQNNIQALMETKNLDNLYWNNHTDATYFKYFYNKTQDPVKKDNFLWRFEVTTQRATFYKDKISSTFKTVFR